MEQLTGLIEKEFSAALPEKFGIVIDGWTDSATSTHYLYIFACYADKDDKTIFVLLAFSPSNDEEKLDAKSHISFIESTFAVYERELSTVSFIIAGGHQPMR